MNCIDCGNEFTVDDYLYNNSDTCKICINKNYPNLVKDWERKVKGGEVNG